MTTTAQQIDKPAAATEWRARRRARVAAVAAGVAAPLATWTVVEVAFGVDLQAPGFDGSGRSFDIGPQQVVFTAGLASLAGWGLLAVLERLASRARRTWVRRAWVVVASAALLASLGGPLSGSGITAGNRAVLAGMHLVVGAVLIPTLSRTSSERAAAATGRRRP